MSFPARWLAAMLLVLWPAVLSPDLVLAAEKPLPLITQAIVALPGSSSRFDYQSLDPGSGRLFISHMGDGSVIVFNTRDNHVLAHLNGFPGATGITAVPSTNRVYVSVTEALLGRATGQEGEIAVVDAATLAVVARVPGGRFPDGSAYAPAVHRLYVSDEAGDSETVIDTLSNRRIATIPLGGSAGMSAYDPESGDIFVNVQNRRMLAEINPVTNSIAARWPLPRDCDHNHGLLLHPDKRIAFVACDGNARLLVLDLRTHVVANVFSVGRHPDVLALDPVRNRLYVASESGVAAVFGIRGGAVEKLGQGFVADDAHSVSVDSATGLVYFPVPNVDGRPALKIMSFQPPASVAASAGAGTVAPNPSRHQR